MRLIRIRDMLLMWKLMPKVAAFVVVFVAPATPPVLFLLYNLYRSSTAIEIPPSLNQHVPNHLDSNVCHQLGL